MPITVHKLPEVPETYFLDEARTMPTAHFATASPDAGYLGGRIKRLVGSGITAGWALPVKSPAGDAMASYLALELMRERSQHGRWVMVLVPEESGDESEAASWSYMQTAMAWEVGLVGAVVGGNVRDIDESTDKLGKEFGVFAYGTSPVASTMTATGSIGDPVVLNGVTVRAGDLIVGDEDGVICVPRDQVEEAFNACRDEIVNVCNQLAAVREGKGAVDVMNLADKLMGEVEKGD